MRPEQAYARQVCVVRTKGAVYFHLSPPLILPNPSTLPPLHQPHYQVNSHRILEI